MSPGTRIPGSSTLCLSRTTKPRPTLCQLVWALKVATSYPFSPNPRLLELPFNFSPRQLSWRQLVPTVLIRPEERLRGSDEAHTTKALARRSCPPPPHIPITLFPSSMSDVFGANFASELSFPFSFLLSSFLSAFFPLGPAKMHIIKENLSN